MELNDDGSMVGKSFTTETKAIRPEPPKFGQETYAQYHRRVKIARETGFHLGDLGWSEYTYYCMGSGSYEGVDADSIIGDSDF